MCMNKSMKYESYNQVRLLYEYKNIKYYYS